MLSSDNTDTDFYINNTQQISDVGLDEGLGEPEMEEENQKKIVPKRKKRTSLLRAKQPNFNEDCRRSYSKINS